MRDVVHPWVSSGALAPFQVWQAAYAVACAEPSR